MKKLLKSYSIKALVTLSVLGMTIALTNTALAVPAQYVSGPASPGPTGWYTHIPVIVKVMYYDNGDPSKGSVADIQITGWGWGGGPEPIQVQPGRHYIKLQSDNTSGICIYNDGAMLYLTKGWQDPCYPTSTLWEGYIQWDTIIPTVSITSPQNGLTISDEKVAISGNVSDVGSGVSTVSVNDVSASISGGNYTATIPLALGANTITVFATDAAGLHSTSHQIVITRNKNAESIAGTKGNNTAVITTGPPNATDNKTPESTSDSNKSNLKVNRNIVLYLKYTPRPIKNVVKFGLGYSILAAFKLLPIKYSTMLLSELNHVVYN